MNLYSEGKEGMLLTIRRYKSSDKGTVGRLYVDGVYQCFTLEDIVRPEGEKIYGKTAIPAGNYEVIIDMSKRFGKLMPHVLNVPMFDGIRIHAGNTSGDTLGCILVGRTNPVRGQIGESQLAFDALMSTLKHGLQNGKIFLDIMNA
jgi:hypothetical protein